MPDTTTAIRALLRVASPVYDDVANDVLRDELAFEHVAVLIALAAVAVAAALLAFERRDLVTP